ncbi:40_t:CDS:2 [Diversispora eburnea]|uniref:40_t:CDS:1 n=1 Tax=Diversispora eburnea TaxID=1213867 RepID=A0A9N8W5B1_9GLOM|nr:40_t:CDS:2 [Diversispora eburnea]
MDKLLKNNRADSERNENENEEKGEDIINTEGEINYQEECKELLNQGLVMFEFQGELGTEYEDIKGKYIGKLQLNDKGIPIIEIGRWFIEGKIVELEKPIMVVKRVPSLSDQIEQIDPNKNVNLKSESFLLAENFARTVRMNSNGNNNGDDSLKDNNDLFSSLNHDKVLSNKKVYVEKNSKVGYDVVKVFRKVLLFNNRPVPLREGCEL